MEQFDYCFHDLKTSRNPLNTSIFSSCCCFTTNSFCSSSWWLASASSFSQSRYVPFLVSVSSWMAVALMALVVYWMLLALMLMAQVVVLAVGHTDDVRCRTKLSALRLVYSHTPLRVPKKTHMCASLFRSYCCYPQPACSWTLLFSIYPPPAFPSC